MKGKDSTHNTLHGSIEKLHPKNHCGLIQNLTLREQEEQRGRATFHLTDTLVVFGHCIEVLGHLPGLPS